MTDPQLVTIPKNTQGRDFAVGDIHGCFTALEDALDKIGFDPEIDRLFSVGDLVDRGPESHLVLDWLAKPWFYAIQGNHDFMTWRAALGDPFLEVDYEFHGGGWLAKEHPDKRRKIGEALKALPLGMEIETDCGRVGLIHGDYPSDDWQDMHKPFSDQEVRMCLWSAFRITKNYAYPVRNIDAIVHGHYVVPEFSALGNVFYIDTVGWPENGHFTLLDLNTFEPHLGAPVHESYL